jgi:hypothetical protein
MLQKIVESFEDMNEISVAIMRYGVALACGVLLIALAIIGQYHGETLRELSIMRDVYEIAKKGITLFSEFLFAGIFIDMLARRMKK